MADGSEGRQQPERGSRITSTRVWALVGVVVFGAAAMWVWGLSPRVWQGTAADIGEIPRVGPSLRGFKVSGRVRYYVWERPFPHGSRLYVISGTTTAADARDWANANGMGYGIEEIGSADLADLLKQYGVEPERFPTRFHDDLWIMAKSRDLRHLELRVRYEDGAFLLVGG